jgi:hypothetical protein
MRTLVLGGLFLLFYSALYQETHSGILITSRHEIEEELREIQIQIDVFRQSKLVYESEADKIKLALKNFKEKYFMALLIRRTIKRSLDSLEAVFHHFLITKKVRDPDVFIAEIEAKIKADRWEVTLAGKEQLNSMIKEILSILSYLTVSSIRSPYQSKLNGLKNSLVAIDKKVFGREGADKILVRMCKWTVLIHSAAPAYTKFDPVMAKANLHEISSLRTLIQLLHADNDTKSVLTRVIDDRISEYLWRLEYMKYGIPPKNYNTVGKLAIESNNSASKEEVDIKVGEYPGMGRFSRYMTPEQLALKQRTEDLIENLDSWSQIFGMNMEVMKEFKKKFELFRLNYFNRTDKMTYVTNRLEIYGIVLQSMLIRARVTDSKADVFYIKSKVDNFPMEFSTDSMIRFRNILLVYSRFLDNLQDMGLLFQILKLDDSINKLYKKLSRPPNLSKLVEEARAKLNQVVNEVWMDPHVRYNTELRLELHKEVQDHIELVRQLFLYREEKKHVLNEMEYLLATMLGKRIPYRNIPPRRTV